jgi:carbamoyl-phosphate synthase large subunit
MKKLPRSRWHLSQALVVGDLTGSVSSMSRDDAGTTVLVTGVGAVIGQGIIRSLRLAPEPIRIVGLDRNPQAFGARWCDHFVCKPGSEKGKQYRNFLLELFESQAIDLVIPGIEQDVFFFDEDRSFHTDDKPVIVLNRPEVVALGKDKWATHEQLAAAGLDVIPSRVSGSWEECLEELGPPPLLMKPRRSSGGKGIVELHDERDFDYWRERSGGDFMVQRIVGSDDQEYTVSVFGFGDGGGTEPAIMRRRLGPDGATWWAETVASCPPISDYSDALTRELAPIGPTNYQFRLCNDHAMLLEINPRVSASTSFRAALGVNEALMCIEFFLRHRRPADASLKPGRAWRFVEDLVELS